jgi:hypothetical protein
MSGDGRFVAVSDVQKVGIYDQREQTCTHLPTRLQAPTALAFGPISGKLAVAGDNVLEVWKPGLLAMERRQENFPSYIREIEFDPTEGSMAIVSVFDRDTGQISVVDTESGELQYSSLLSVENLESGRRFAFSPDSRF